MRQLNPYEKTHLARYLNHPVDLESIGEMPVEYVTGKVEFMDQVFDINQSVLIPRIETEELVKMAIKLAQEIEFERELTIFDVGTGSGAIGISLFLGLLKINPDLAAKTRLIMSDISKEIIEVATLNLQNLVPAEYHSKFQILVSNLLDEFPPLKADLVLANLPYIPEYRINSLDASVKDFEPRVALSGGDSGLNLIQQMIEQLPPKILPHGQVLLEVDHTHQAAELKLRPSQWQAEDIFDQFQRQRFIKLRTTSLEPKSNVE